MIAVYWVSWSSGMRMAQDKLKQHESLFLPRFIFSLNKPSLDGCIVWLISRVLTKLILTILTSVLIAFMEKKCFHRSLPFLLTSVYIHLCFFQIAMKLLCTLKKILITYQYLIILVIFYIYIVSELSLLFLLKYYTFKLSKLSYKF